LQPRSAIGGPLQLSDQVHPRSQKLLFRAWCIDVVLLEMAKYEYDHPSVRVASEGFLALGGSDNKVRLYTDGSGGLKLVEKWSKHKFPIHSLCVVKEAGVFQEIQWVFWSC